MSERDPAAQIVADWARLEEENQRLRAELEDARETIRAIHEGEVDAIVVSGKQGEQVFSLSGAESVYRLIVQTMQEAALTVTPDGTILSCNPQFEKLIHFTSGWVIGRPLEAFVMPDERAKVTGLLARSRMEPVRERLVFRATDGSPVPTHVSADAFQQPDGPSICLVATDLSQLESSIEELQERTVELSRAIEKSEAQAGQLRSLAAELNMAEQRERQRLAEVLHDGVQQVLVACRLRVSLLEQNKDPGVWEACDDLSRLLEQALTLSRGLTAELSPPVLRQEGLVPALEWLARWMEETHHLKVDIQAEGILPLDQPAKLLLFQSVRELLFNVVKHSRASTAEVQVGRTDGQVRIVVADQGAGFDPDRNQPVGGGLGLSSIRERIQFLGGTVAIASAPGQGSRFTLTVPLAKQKASAPPEEPPETAGQKLRILVADDHRILRQALSRMLSREPDLQVVAEAADGEEAVRLARQCLPDVVLMDVDVSMPGLGGVDATRLLRTELPRIQVIGLSMVENAGPAMREAGAVAFLTKSGPTEDLLAAIRACQPQPPPQTRG
jgi:PAS domain S-box-containing protein